MRELQTLAAQAVESTMETERSGPTEQYIQWLRTEFSAGRWAAEPSQPCLLYKVYKETTRIPLDGDIPLQLGKDHEATWEAIPSVQQASPEQKLSWLLYYTHGLTRILRPNAGQATSLGEKSKEEAMPHPRHVVGPVAHYSPFLGRPIPSGGSLHPVEIYLAVGGIGVHWRLPAGIYHYDSTHHALDLLRNGDFMPEIAACLPVDYSSASISATIFLTNCIQKNHQKYTYLSYLLQTLDTGIALQQLRFVAYRLGLSLATHLSFIDNPLHCLLDLDPSEELIYAALPLYSGQSHSHLEEKKASASATSAYQRQLSDLSPLSTGHIQPFTPRTQSSLLKELYAASLLDSLPNESSISLPDAEEVVAAQEQVLPDVALPQKRDLAQVLLRRHTSSQSIDTREITIEQLAAILKPLRQVESPLWRLFDCQLYCVISRISSVTPDVYRYCREKHTLVPLHTPSLIPLLIRISTGSNIQLQLAPLNLFFCGNCHNAQAYYGERGLRMLGIEIGRMLQCILLSTTVCDLGTHVHVSRFMEGIRKRLLHIPNTANLPLASMMIGHKRNTEENLFEMIWF